MWEEFLRKRFFGTIWGLPGFFCPCHQIILLGSLYFLFSRLQAPWEVLPVKWYRTSGRETFH